MTRHPAEFPPRRKDSRRLTCLMISSVLYVSSSLLSSDGQPEEIEKILAAARARNATLGVTGALVFTEARFAQILEGGEDSVAQIMASIKQDSRHKDVQIVEMSRIAERRFAGWTMAYSGPSFYVDRHIKPLVASTLEAVPREKLAIKLISFMQDLVNGLPR